MRARINVRRGATAIIAMLYLILFSSLAVGFAAATQTAVQVAYNDDAAQRATLAAESGMGFVRYQLSQLSIDRKTKPDQLVDTVYNQLGQMMNGSPNLSGKSIALVNGEIHIPGLDSQWVSVNDDEGKFRAIIEPLEGGSPTDRPLRVRIAGAHKDKSSNARGIRLDFDITERRSPVFDFGVAARGQVITGGASRVRGDTDPARGSILSASTDPVPVTIGGKEVSGSISITNPNGTVRVSGNAVGGDIHKGVDEPEFPMIDADVFLPYVKNTYTGGKSADNKFLENVRIPANTNPTFAGGTTLSGVIYVESPNKLTFRGNTTVKGIIVVENNPKGNINTNVLDFAGNVTGVSVRDLTAADVPSLNSSELAELRKMTGSFILAHGFKASFTGSFESISGSILADQISMTGNAGGKIKGSMVNLTTAPMTLNGSSEVKVGEKDTDRPAGVYYGRNYVPVMATYDEFRP
jgi:hypothetical protein